MHAYNVFLHNLGLSIVKLSTDHILFLQLSHLFVLSLLYVSPVLCLLIYHGTCTPVLYLYFMYMCII